MKISRPKKLQHDRDMFECRSSALLTNTTDGEDIVFWLNQMETPSKHEIPVCVKLVFAADEAEKFAKRLLDGVARCREQKKGEE